MITIIAQHDWRETFENSGYLMRSFATLADVDESSVIRYLYKGRTPRKENRDKMEKAMYRASQKPRIKFHLAYGYATAEQIARLKEIGVGLERDQIMKEIYEQTKTRESIYDKHA